METKTPKSDSAVSLVDVLTRLVPDQRTILDIGADGQTKKIDVSLQRLEPPPPKLLPRLETQARHHSFYEAKGFAAYLNRYAEKGDVVVFANPETEEVFSTLKEKAEGGRETVLFKPQLHPLWKPWHELVAKGRVSLDEFRTFLSVNRRAIHLPDGRTLALQMQQLRAAVKVTIENGRGATSLNGIMVETNIAGVANKEVLPLPDEIVLHVPLYVGEEPQDVHIDLLVDANARGEISVLIGASGVQEARVFAFDSMCADIREALKDHDATVTYGTPQETGWSYLGADNEQG